MAFVALTGRRCRTATQARDTKPPSEPRPRLRRAVLALVVILGTAGATTVSAHASVAVEPVDLGTLYGGSSRAQAVAGDIIVGYSYTEDSGRAFVYDLAAAEPAMVDLGTLGGDYSSAIATDGTRVVGESRVAGDGSMHPFVYDLRSAEMTDLGTLGGEGSAYDVDGDIVVGSSQPSYGRTHAVVYDLSGSQPELIDLGTLGGNFGYATEVDGSLVIGRSDTAEGPQHSFAYDLAATQPEMVDLGTLGGDETTAVGLDDQVVVGWSSTTDGSYHAFAYDLAAQNPVMIDLGTLGGGFSAAAEVEDGVVVGYAANAEGSLRAFAYDLRAANPSMIDLGSLDPGNSFASDVDRGTVVGRSYTADGVRGFAYDLGAAQPQMVELGTLGGPGSLASAISGDIVVGEAKTTDDSSEGHAVAWRLSPRSTTNTSTALTSSADRAVVGSDVTYTATVSPVPASGTVGFSDGGTAIDGCEQQAVDVTTGTATCTVTHTDVGRHSITAEYSGGPGFAASRSTALLQSIAYAVDLRYDPSKPRKGASVPVKVQLLDAAGSNLSTADVIVTVTGLSPDPSPGARPVGTFEQVLFGDEPGYQFNVKTRGYPAGTYTLSFVAGVDPTTHTAEFSVLR